MSPRRRANAGETSAAAFVAGRAKNLDLALGKAIRRVTTNTDPEALHDMRVAIRRLRTLLRIARPLYGRHRTDSVRSAFSVVQSRTGDLRDEEALEQTWGTLAVDDPAFAEWRLRRKNREKKLRASLVAALRSGELARARKLLGALLLFPPKRSRDEDVARFARRAVLRARKNVDRLRDVPTSDVEQMHTLRILYKELRYAAEMFAEVLPLDLSVLIAPAAKLQKRLGDIHDIDTALEAVEHARRLPSETRARVAGALVELRARKAKKYLEDTAQTGKDAAKAEPSPDVSPISRAVAPESRREETLHFPGKLERVPGGRLEGADPDARDLPADPPQALGVEGLRKISTF
jgi:CHAD domain-containing protein